VLTSNPLRSAAWRRVCPCDDALNHDVLNHDALDHDALDQDALDQDALKTASDNKAGEKAFMNWLNRKWRPFT
jgi:hypothetical protein